MAIEALGGASPALVLASDRRMPGGVVRQQGPGPAAESAGDGRAVQVLAAVEVTIHPAHPSVEHVAGAVTAGVRIGLGVLLRPAAQLLDPLPQPRRHLAVAGPLAEPPQPLRECPTRGRVIRLPDPFRQLPERLAELAPAADVQ